MFERSTVLNAILARGGRLALKRVRSVSQCKVCVIGAGSSGITAAKALADRGVDFDCFEKTDGVGGLWVFDAERRAGAAYRSLVSNTSRQRTGFRDFPMPDTFADFPHHTQMAAYFNDYVDHFGLRDRIVLNTEVTRAERREDQTWRIQLNGGETRPYDVLIVANGHHWDPRWPEPPFSGQYGGDVIHGHDYRSLTEPLDLRGRRVLVVGLGNSAADIASELSGPGKARTVLLSARRGAWILPKRFWGRPLDRLPGTHPRTPWRVQSLILSILLRLSGRLPWRFGLPKPDHRILAAHPTISDTLLERVREGLISHKPAVAAFRDRRARFVDGSEEAVDAVIYCTGYKVTFPFFDPEFLAAPDNDLPLWRHLVRPGDKTLFFVGLVQPLGAIMPIAEAQSRLIADHVCGRYALPSRKQMTMEMDLERHRMFSRYVTSQRHTMEVDFDRYIYDLKREHEAGRRRVEAMF